MSVDPPNLAPPRLAGYKFRRPIGRGGTGIVWEAYDPELERRAAIKIIQLDNKSEHERDELRTRFRQEAQLTAKLHHPGIVGVYSYMETAENASLITEYIDGGTLRGSLDRGERLGVERIITIMASVLDTLEYCHRQGVVHRDIKPSNLMLTMAGETKVGDFGVARREASDLTTLGTVIGTLPYMSPEQYTATRPADERSDVWSCGVVLYELLTGKRPFRGNPTVVMQQVLNLTPPPPSSLVPDLPPALDAVIMRAIAKAAEERYQSATTFAAALRDLLRPSHIEVEPEATVILPAMSIAARTPALPLAAPITAPITIRLAVPLAGPVGTPVTAKRPPWAWIIASVGFLLIGAGGAAWWLRANGIEPPPTVRVDRVAPTETPSSSSSSAVPSASTPAALPTPGLEPSPPLAVAPPRVVETVPTPPPAVAESIVPPSRDAIPIEPPPTAIADIQAARPPVFSLPPPEMMPPDAPPTVVPPTVLPPAVATVTLPPTPATPPPPRPAEIAPPTAEPPPLPLPGALTQLARPARQGQAAQAGWSVDGRSGCKVWNPTPVDGQSVSWSGACQNSVAHGEGLLQWQQPGGVARYVGTMRSGVRDGAGRLEFANGIRFETRFVNGRPDGPATITSKDGTVMNATARDGCVYLDGQFVMELGRGREGCAAKP